MPLIPVINPHGWTVSATQGGHYAVPIQAMSPGDRVGISGLATCIGVICHSGQGPNGMILAVHFGSQENPSVTLDRYRALFHNNSQVYVVHSTQADAGLLNDVVNHLSNAFNVRAMVMAWSNVYIDENMQMSISTNIP